MGKKRALIAVYDKTGIVELASELIKFGYEIISTGGTMKTLQDAGVAVTSVSDITGFPEILDGRLKTLHPLIHGGILGIRNSEKHRQQMSEHGIEPIDLVIVNLYPFEKVTASPNVTEEEAIENIDIGGPTMIRAAAKNFNDVTVITSPEYYPELLAELKHNNGSTSLEFRKRMAIATFGKTANYDAIINSYFKKKSDQFPDTLASQFRLQNTLRYGENPHQKAALYEVPNYRYSSIARARFLAGKELSFNNIWDLEAGLQMILDFTEPFAAIIKHTNPCGAAIGGTLAVAYKRAYDADPVSAYGSVIALNKTVDMDTAKLLHETPFVECILAPSYQPDAIALLVTKKNRRILELGDLLVPPEDEYEYRYISGGLLAQSADRRNVAKADLQFVTDKKPSNDQIAELLFAFKIVKHIKSNAIVICRNWTTVGVGPGQTSRVESAVIAVRKAGDLARGAVAGSDAFFPMPDGLEVLANAGVTAVIQPGGSKQDPEVIKAANRLGVAMVFTGIRHFRH